MSIAIKMAGKEIASYDTTTDKVAIKLSDDVSINDSAGNVVLNESGGSVNLGDSITFSANHAGIKTALNASGDAPVYACRAWVNFNGFDTVAIRASGNVSSITDLGPGSYEVNFTTAMQDANYAVTWEADQVMPYVPNSQSSTSARVESRNGINENTDCSFGVVAIFR